MFQACRSEVEFRPLVELRLWFTNQSRFGIGTVADRVEFHHFKVVRSNLGKVPRLLYRSACQGHIVVYKDVSCTQIQI